jgi:hypothetical protein
LGCRRDLREPRPYICQRYRADDTKPAPTLPTMPHESHTFEVPQT